KLCLLRKVDGFYVVATMRSDEWDKNQRALTEAGYTGIKLPWGNVRLWEVLQKRVLAWGGPDLAPRDLEPLEGQLRAKSEGAPAYLELLVNVLAAEGKLASLNPSQLIEQLEDLRAQGVSNLVWDV